MHAIYLLLNLCFNINMTFKLYSMGGKGVVAENGVYSVAVLINA